MKLWPFKTGARGLSEELRGALFTMFGVESADAEPMRYVTKSGKFANVPVNRVCIFNPATLSGPELAACSYDSLISLNKGLLFTGHIFKKTDNAKANVILKRHATLPEVRDQLVTPVRTACQSSSRISGLG